MLCEVLYNSFDSRIGVSVASYSIAMARITQTEVMKDYEAVSTPKHFLDSNIITIGILQK